MRVLKNMEPENVLRFFEDISAIPRGSGNTNAISDHCVKAAEAMGLTATKDSANNVIIKKPGSKGCEDKPAVILQAHLDMVCEKNSDCDFDFLKEGIKLIAEGDFIRADGTTLGSDDGMGLSMIMAVLEDKSLAHPPIEAVFTSDEETGMDGAIALDPSLLSGRRMINIDSDAEGILTVGCAGGARVEIDIPVKKAHLNAPCFEIKISGLKGGHSGVEIDKGRHNANVLMGRFLNTIPADYNIIDISGGGKDNAIPAISVCKVSANTDLSSLAKDFIAQNKTLEEPELSVEITRIPAAEKGFTADDSQKIADFLTTVKNGVQAMSEDIPGLVETSLNLGILKTEGDLVLARTSVRSSVNSAKEALIADLYKTAAEFGAACRDNSHYPAWEYRKNSPLRDVMVSEYETLFGARPIVEAIHAGLECGLFSEKLPGLDAVSFGPTTYDIHTPSERVSVSSVQRSYKYLCKILENL